MYFNGDLEESIFTGTKLEITPGKKFLDNYIL